ncbi:MAG: hypothetical protein ACM3S1_09570 [Hyphomicrobiales bacterium]
MSGIFYDPKARRMRAVNGTPQAEWAFVTHNLNAGVHQCRRIMREWLPSEELSRVDWSDIAERRA